MADILATVSGQSLVFTSMPVITSHGVNEDYVEFTFDAEWTGYSKVATFYHERFPEDIFVSVVGGSNRALVPHEVTRNAGRIFIGVTGTQGSIKLTSEVQPYPILPGSNEDGVNSEPITPELYDQILSAMAEMVGTPLTANTAADMVDTTRIYVYTGSEVGYVNGSWYYYDGASWQVGGTYNSQAISDAFYDDIAQLVKQSAVATESDSTPYLYRATPNPSAILADEEIVGGTIAHNQLIQLRASGATVNGITFTIGTDGKLIANNTSTGISAISTTDSNFPVYADHVYLLRGCPAGGSSSTYRLFPSSSVAFPTSNRISDTGNGDIKKALGDDNISINAYVYSGAGAVTNLTFVPQLCDLTADYGSVIADYSLSLESGTPGAGVAKLREWGFLSKIYSPYNAGSLVSVNTEGKEVTGSNIFGGSLMREGIKAALGTTTEDVENNTISFVQNASTIQAFTDECELTGKFKENTQYTIVLTCEKTSANSCNVRIMYTDGTSTMLGNLSAANTKESIVFVSAAGKTVDRIYKYNQNNGTVKIYCNESGVFEGANHQFFPFKSTTYHTTPTDLRGVFYLDENNQPRTNGDVYHADGTITRKWRYIDVGAKTWTRRTNDGTNPVFRSGASDRKYGTNAADIMGLCARYQFYGNDTLANMANNMPNKYFGFQTTTNYIVVRDDDYTDEGTFTTANENNFMIYPLATETTETADPYTATQIVGKGGTEEWIDNRAVPVPVGHETVYGIGVPDVPSNANAATLHATVTNGKTVLTWS